MKRRVPGTVRIPVSTYRLQFNRQFTLRDAADLVDYLDELGVSDGYASPLCAARPGSPHGYDVVDHSRINPDLGTLADLENLSQRLAGHAMGLMLDVVPNHMCIADDGNRWWNDLLENGPSSPYAKFFDVDWHPPKVDLLNKVLLPILGDSFGRVLEGQQVSIQFEGGAFYARCYSRRLPLAPKSWPVILEPVLEELRPCDAVPPPPFVVELESILTAIRHLPGREETGEEAVRERQREKEVIKRRLASVVAASGELSDALDRSLAALNGVPGDPRSFDRLEELLTDQAYRLSFWRVAADEINYRRFFDINELASLRVEERQVFEETHGLLFDLVRKGWVTGLRVDHVDGLYDPQGYLRDLQWSCAVARTGRALESLKRRQGAGPRNCGRSFYVVVEKILGPGELVDERWPVHGTTGYEFLNSVNGLFVDGSASQDFPRLYQRFTHETVNVEELLHTCKKLIMLVSLSSELYVLACRLDRISEQHRDSRDFTLESLRFALREVIATLPVYRTYLRADQDSMSEGDRHHVETAIREAKRRNPAVSRSIFDFIGSVLQQDHPVGISEAQKEERRRFVLRFQQLTGPVMAKGIEDTAFYRYFPLASLNEVGGDLQSFAVATEAFHRACSERQERWPHSLSATATHDTKRGEDVRTRLNALSEIPGRWERAVRRWHDRNHALRPQVEGRDVPSRSDEYLIYQTLVGTWPWTDGDASWETYPARVKEYLLKALREAKVCTSWINPNVPYEAAVTTFVDRILDRGRNRGFLDDLDAFLAPVARAGVMSSLAQTLLKITAPGVPDFYQGTELWDFSLVDPDNRRPVDYGLRRGMLAALHHDEEETGPAALVERLLAEPADGRLKLYVTSRGLRFRREHARLFLDGKYQPIQAQGVRRECTVAFARELGRTAAITVAGRFFLRQDPAGHWPAARQALGATCVVLPESLARARFRDVLTGKIVRPRGTPRHALLHLAEVFAHLPVALLVPMQQTARAGRRNGGMRPGGV